MAISIPGFTLGIIGGGQLGRMMAIEARRLGIRTVALDPSERPPAHGIADETLVGSLQDARSLQKLAQKANVLTYEIEHINIQALKELDAEGTVIRPGPAILEIIQDKLRQKQFWLQKNLPVPQYWLENPQRYPVVQKLRKGGYDGRGVAVLASPSDPLLEGESLFEECIAIEVELAVVVARGLTGELRTYPVIEMVFDPQAQICSSVAAPARVTPAVAQTATQVATAAVEALGGVGIFAVELFLAKDGRVLINEIAPRPHNSGHWTINGAVTNQFEQHIRAVCGLPLGPMDLVRPSVMINLLGAPDAEGSPLIRGYEEAMALPGVAFHWYQKGAVSPLRKMGHVTITHESLDGALSLAAQVQDLVRVEGSKRGQA